MNPNTNSEQDQRFMERALALAEAAAHAGETPIGCVIVDGESGAVIAEGANTPIKAHDPTAHAEIVALRRAAQLLGNYRLKQGLTLYVTLEPCAMCAGAISNARIARVVYGASDPKSGGLTHGPRVFDHPQTHWKPMVQGGVCANEAAALLKDFFKARR
jgi:tRNA(Arg) A34 adenosine deaminase TadA